MTGEESLTCCAIAVLEPSFLASLLIKAKRLFTKKPVSNLIRHAEEEMRLAGLYDIDSDYGGMIPEAVMRLVRAHADEGHSGGSHSVTMAVFNRVINFKTLTPLTNRPDQWMDVSNYGGPDQPAVWQSKRQSSCFSNDGGKTYYDIDDPKREVKISAEA